MEQKVQRVKNKLNHWNISPKCSRTIEQMVSLEEKGKLSFYTIKRLSEIPCIQCELCMGQKSLDDYVGK